jgi:Tol biopolymer transport system component
VGTLLGPYEVTAQIGKGGMGEVYRARDRRLDRTVAIKVLPAEVASDAEARARFEREARTVAALDHPHICAIYDVGSVDGTHYLVMPYLDGRSLAARLEHGALPIDQGLKIAAELADALDRAHRQGITHRDVKPANVMMTKTGSKLLDFGLAKLRGPVTPISTSSSSDIATRSPTTAQGTILGTMQYMAPEQVEGKEADARSDVWALGTVIYEMVTGSRPFQGETPASVIGAILKDEPSPVSRIQPLAPTVLDHIVTRCLSKDPENRWQSARDVSHALAMVGEASVARAHVLPPRRTMAIASVAGFLTAVAIGTLLWATWPRAEAERRPLSFHLTPPADAEFQFSPNAGGSAISPDGQSVAFVAVANGTSRLWIRTLDSLTARELPDTEGARFPFWSPDSGSIGFFTSTDLRRIGVSGGLSVVLARAGDARGGAWNADGTIVFSPYSVGPLYRISASGGTPVPLTALSAGEFTHRWPKFLPDGRTLLYFGQGPKAGVYLTTLDRPANTTFLLDSTSDATYVPGPRDSPGYLLWIARDAVMAQPFDPQSASLMGSAVAVPGSGFAAAVLSTQRASLSASNDGTLLYSSGGARYQLAWFGRDGTPRGTLGAVEQYIGLRLSPDGSEVLVTIRDVAASGDLWRIDLASGARSRVTSDGGGWYGVWSPDSQQVMFTALNRREVLRAAKVRGGGDIQDVSTFDRQVYPSDWSFDGTYLAYAANNEKTANDVWVLPMTGAPKPAAILQTSFNEHHAQFSPDGRWLVFTSNQSGRDDVYVQSFPDASTRRIVSSAGGAYPRWSRSGRELFYRTPDGRLMTIPVRLAGSSVQLGTPSVVMRLVEAAGLHPYPYDVAADGRILALTPASGAVQDLTLTVLMNWQAALEESKRLVPAN